MLLKRTDMPCFRQCQNSFKKKSVRFDAHTMLTVFPKTCSEGPNPQVPDLTGKNAASPGIARDCIVLKCSQRSLKSTGGHCVPTTRNQFAGNCTWVRIPPAAPCRSKRHIACSDFFAKGRARSFCCSPAPNRSRFAGGWPGSEDRPVRLHLLAASALNRLPR